MVVGDQPAAIRLLLPDDGTAQPVAASRVAGGHAREAPDEMGARHVAANTDRQIMFFYGEAIREILEAIHHLGAQRFNAAAKRRNGVVDYGVGCIEHHHAVDILGAEGFAPFVEGCPDKGFIGHHFFLTKRGRGRIRALRRLPS